MPGLFPGSGPRRASRFVANRSGERILPLTVGAKSAFGIWPGGGPNPGRRFLPRNLSTKFFTLSGVTRDSSGAALGNCVVILFLTGDNSFVATATSDGLGNYSFTRGNNLAVFMVAFKNGSPAIAGVTINTLTGS
jgi:hypothetical protein